MAQPARRQPHVDEDVPLDPAAVERAYRLERARRRARVTKARERKRADVRFWVTLTTLLVAFVVLALTIWNQIEQLFGL